MVRITGFTLSLLLFLSVSTFALAEEQTVEVGRFLREAKAGGGSSAVLGVVCSANPAEKRFGLSDARKSGCCDSAAKCVSGVLPVKWAGALPKEKATVRVRGKVVEEGGRLLFDAEDVKVLEDAKK